MAHAASDPDDVSEVTAEGTRIDRFAIDSPSMGRPIKVVVVLPPAYLDHKSKDKTFPILYTLHGYGAPYDTWANMPKLRDSLSEMPFVYTCLDGDVGSFYIDAYYPIRTARKAEQATDDTEKKSKFVTFFFDEFIPEIDKRYRIDKNNRAVTGFSMGGSGAMTFMLERPEMFRSVSGLSSAYLDLIGPNPRRLERLVPMLGDPNEFPERYTAIDHYAQLNKHLENATGLPPIYQHIGTEDFLLEENRKFRDFAQEHGLTLTYRETEGGHNWKFWHPASVEIAIFHWKHFEPDNR